MPLTLILEWEEEEAIDVGLNLADSMLTASLDFENIQQSWQLRKGKIGLGKPAEEVADSDGINIEVALPYFDFDPWIALLTSEDGNGDEGSRINQIKGEIQQAQLMGGSLGA